MFHPCLQTGEGKVQLSYPDLAIDVPCLLEETLGEGISDVLAIEELCKHQMEKEYQL